MNAERNSRESGAGVRAIEMCSDDGQARPGRPRDFEIDAAINRAVLESLQEVGYTKLSYDQVATRAGVSRPTLYRRAANKAALVVTALVDRYGLTPVPDTGSIALDLLKLQRAQIRLYNDPAFGAALPGLLADIRTNVDAREVWVDGFVRPRRDGVAVAVQRGITRGELADDTDAEWVCEILTGPMISAAFLTGPHRLHTDLATETVTLVLNRFRQSGISEP